MRILVLSDLHLEFGNPLEVPADVEYDVVVLAGDIHAPGRRAIAWASLPETFDGRPVVFVPGNHEYYGTEIDSELNAMREAAVGTHVHVLAPGEVVLDGVRFIGTTMWTDFELPVAGKSIGGSLEARGWAMKAAHMAMADYSRIRVRDASTDVQRRLTPNDTLMLHMAERAWLLERVHLPFAGPTVVVTHHGPSDGSVAPRYAADLVTPAFVSHLPDEFFEVPVLWVHGHTHTRFDYTRGRCRVVSNPRGYRAPSGAWENHLFRARFVVDVGNAVDES